MIPQPPRSTRTASRFPYTTLFRSKGRLKGADEDGEDRIGVDAAQKPLERLGKAVIHVHRVGHGGVDSGSTDRLDRLDGKLPRHIEPSRRTSDVCDGSRFNANDEGRHAVHVVTAIMVNAEENDQFRGYRANARARRLDGPRTVEYRKAHARRKNKQPK